MNLNKMSLKSKLVSIVVATIVLLSALFAVMLHTESTLLLRDREEKVRNLVETAHGVVAHYEKLSRGGAMSSEEAKKAAKEALRALRYDKDQYFWINDMAPTMVMHPTKPELEGKDLSQSKDLNGKFLFVEFVKTVRATGGGLVDYFWPKPGGTEAVEKISYVKGFEPWGWVIGTGIYIDDVNAIFWAQAFKLLAWGVVIGGLIAGSLTLLSRHLVGLLGGEPAYAVEITRRIATGDLTGEVRCRSGDNGSLLAGMRDMQATLRGMIGDVHVSAQQLSSASDRLLSTAG